MKNRLKAMYDKDKNIMPLIEALEKGEITIVDVMNITDSDVRDAVKMCQKNPIIVQGRAIYLSKKAMEVFHYMLLFPLMKNTVELYLEMYYDEDDISDSVKNATDEELTKIVEDGVKDEFVSAFNEDKWDNFTIEE